MSAELQSIKTFFASNHITLCPEWLQSCIEWLKDENEGHTFSEQELRHQVYEQWLLLDFTDLQLPILPPDITKEIKFTLNKSICLQVVSVIDISKPKLQQIMKMRKTLTDDHKNEDNQHGKRVLQLKLTDGMQEILATEYQPIHFLNLNLTPGVKVCLNAPLVIRRGQILLKPGNIKVLGGEVEKLLVSNAAENILAGILKLPLNPKPAFIEAYLDNSNMEINNKKDDKPEIRPNINVSENCDKPEIRQFSNLLSVVKKETDSILAEFQDPALFEGTDFAEEMSSIKPKKPPTASFEDVFDEDEYEELMRMDIVAPQPAPSPAKKFMTIEKLSTMVGKINRGNFRIHAQYNTIVEKMSLKDNEFSMKVCLQDETGEGVFAFHSDVISELMGYSPKEMTALRIRVTDKDPDAISTYRLALDQFKEKLLNLDNDMMVLLEASRDNAVVTKLIH